MAPSICLGNKLSVFVLLFSALLLNEALACNSHQKFNKRDRYYRRHNYRRFFGKRSVDDYEKNPETRSVNREKYEFAFVNTSCGGALCDSVSDYPYGEIEKVVKQLRQIYELKKTSYSEEIDLRVMNFLSEYQKSTVSSSESPHIVYEKSKGCKSYGNVSFPQEGYSSDDDQIYYVVNVPDLQQKANGLMCTKSKSECGDDIELPATYSRTCQQVYSDEEFLVLPSNKSSYSVDDFQIRTFLVPDGCKCVLLHTGDYEFLKDN